MFTTSGRTITFPGFLRAYVEDTDDDRRPRRTTPRSGCRNWRAATPSTPRGVRGRPGTPRRRPRATPSRRWSRRWRSSASAGRPPTPRSCRRSRTAATSGRRARRSSRPGRRSRSIGLLELLLRPPGRLRLHRVGRERPRRHRQRRALAGRLADAGSTSAPTAIAPRPTPAAHLRAGRAEAADRSPARGDRRPRGELDPARATACVVRVGRYGPYLQRGEDERRLAARGPRAGRADAGEGRGAAVRAVRRPRARHDRGRPRDHRASPAGTGRTSPTARSRRRCSSRCRWTRSRSRTPSSC